MTEKEAAVVAASKRLIQAEDEYEADQAKEHPHSAVYGVRIARAMIALRRAVCQLEAEQAHQPED